MKKKIHVIFAIGLFTLLTACSTVSQAETPSQNKSVIETEITSQNETSNVQVQGENTENTKILIAYFSRWGNTDYEAGIDASTSASIVIHEGKHYGTTGYVADMIRKLTGGEVYLIETEETYPVDFNDVVSQNHKEMRDGTIPALKDSQLDMAKYDVIFVGYPVWSSNVPQAVQSFLQKYDLTGKTVIPFCTHDGYGAGSSFSTVATVSHGAQVAEGIAIDTEEVSSASDRLRQWVDGLAISKNLLAKGEIMSADKRPIKITIGDLVLDGVLYDNAEARQFISILPETISMVGFGGREFYGGIDGQIQTESEGRYTFEDGNITYCPANNTVAIFYAQTSRPNLTMEVFPMGKVTSDLSVFDELPGMVDITFSLVE